MILLNVVGLYTFESWSSIHDFIIPRMNFKGNKTVFRQYRRFPRRVGVTSNSQFPIGEFANLFFLIIIKVGKADVFTLVPGAYIFGLVVSRIGL